MTPKMVPKRDQNGPKRVPDGVQIASQVKIGPRIYKNRLREGSKRVFRAKKSYEDRSWIVLVRS